MALEGIRLTMGIARLAVYGSIPRVCMVTALKLGYKYIILYIYSLYSATID